MKMKKPTLENVEGLGAGPRQTVANIIDGAQNGIGTHLPYLDGTQPQIFSPTQIVVIGYPTFWDLPGYEYNKPVLKALLERHAHSVSGIDFGYSLQTTETPIGNDSQQLPTPMNTTRGSISPSFSMRELKGNLIWNFIKRWLWDINHPDTNASMVSSLLASEADMPEWVVSTYSMAMLMIQFDETMLPEKIVDGALATAMFPTETGDFGFERQLANYKPMDRTINFKALLQHNANTRELAIYVARALNIHRANYNIATTATGINLGLRSMGVDAEMQKVLNEFNLQSNGGIFSFGVNGNGGATSSGLTGNHAGGTAYDATGQMRPGTSNGQVAGPTETPNFVN